MLNLWNDSAQLKAGEAWQQRSWRRLGRKDRANDERGLPRSDNQNLRRQRQAVQRANNGCETTFPQYLFHNRGPALPANAVRAGLISQRWPIWAGRSAKARAGASRDRVQTNCYGSARCPAFLLRCRICLTKRCCQRWWRQRPSGCNRATAPSPPGTNSASTTTATVSRSSQYRRRRRDYPPWLRARRSVETTDAGASQECADIESRPRLNMEDIHSRSSATRCSQPRCRHHQQAHRL